MLVPILIFVGLIFLCWWATETLGMTLYIKRREEENEEIFENLTENEIKNTRG